MRLRISYYHATCCNVLYVSFASLALLHIHKSIALIENATRTVCSVGRLGALLWRQSPNSLSFALMCFIDVYWLVGSHGRTRVLCWDIEIKISNTSVMGRFEAIRLANQIKQGQDPRSEDTQKSDWPQPPLRLQCARSNCGAARTRQQFN